MKFQILISPLIFVLIMVLTSCQEEFMDEIVIYSNDFSTMDSKNIQSTAGFEEYNDQVVLGFFNNESFTLKLNELPDHNAVRINIDLFIHDSWDGNSQGPGGPDVWKMLVDNELVVNTTFSNSPCESAFCLYQSFPENIFRQFDPKTGATIKDLPGLCQYNGVQGWTSKYRISHLVNHKNRSLEIKCLDELVQTNALNPKCDESWSVGKIQISVLNVQ